mmetsp:Transcript_27947/g.59606  ORF Transcript_27947/g.59606 Transcript_27947/m.59606 type:complete len:1224 (+) Transcript_27947:260-3931(+)|eukprot:CAMPEP_0172314906 /NCGR_PEP_ID=MMETSP1058-20130122/23476_1 /TAXON_ID=83371 /ORGANISM="Detonula confervacea, Strain CCMP 353" /LENGTH=1223 /DNA_ID=CAMNT_0013028859 /DNA_START=186 /DNA_END=3857 /DNA_ORIENTATION=+
MWFIGDDVDDSCGAAIDNSVKTNENISTSEKDAEGIWADNSDMELPLPCPCSSEATLGSLACCESSQSCQKLLHSLSSTVSLSRLKSKRRPIAREVVRGAAAGSTISFILVATLLVFMPESSVRWMQSIHNRVMKETHRHFRQHSYPDIRSTIPNSKEMNTKEAYVGGETLQHTNEPDIYHRKGPIRDTNSYNQSRKNHRRNLQGSYWDLNSDSTGVMYDSSRKNNPPVPLSSPAMAEVAEEPPKDPQLVIAGKMTVENGACNVAQLNLKTGKWSLQQRIQLSLYNSYSGGAVYSLLANHSIVTNSNAKEYSAGDSSSKRVDQPHVTDKNFGSNLIVVGAYDTTYRNSQTTYCSVGKWDGSELSKIGEGLCNSALSKGMKITSAAIAGPNDLYVGGSFQTQVWNGNKHEFVKIFNIAHYNAIDQVWLPLPIGQITCSWCTVTILALAWDSKRRQLHVAGKFNAIDGSNIPAGLAVYDQGSGHLVAHPGGGLSMNNSTQDGVATAVQFDQENGVLYVMGAFERLTATNDECLGLAAYEIKTGSWTCLADPAHSVKPTGGGNMLLTPYGLLVAGKTTNGTMWPDSSRPYTVAVLKATIKKKVMIFEETTTTESHDDEHSDETVDKSSSRSRELDEEKSAEDPGYVNGTKAKAEADHEFIWSWLPGFNGHDEPIHTLSNGFGDYVGTVFIGGDNFVVKWSYKTVPVKCNTTETKRTSSKGRSSSSTSCTQKAFVPVTVNLANDHVHGSIMAISQLDPEIKKGKDKVTTGPSVIGYTIIVYCVTLGALIGMFLALMCNKSINQTIMSFLFDRDAQMKGISLDTLTYSHVQNTNVADAYHRAMSNRFVKHPHLLTLIDPQEVILHRIIGEGTFGRVWSAKWGSSSVAVKEFVFAQAAVAGKSRQQQAIVEEIIGEAGMMAILRHPNVLQLFGCSLTSQAIWIVSEICSLGSLRQLLDDRERTIALSTRLNLALQVAEGMSYLHAQDPPIIHRDLKSHNIFVHETFAEVESKDKSNDSKRLRWPPRLKKSDGANSSGSESGSGGSLKTKSETKSEAGASSTKSKSSMSAKIGDWGSARATLAGSRTMTHGVGTACWMAPEVLKHARSSAYSDVYGFGIVLWELATRREVYEGLESTQIIAMVANDHLRPIVPPGCPWNDVMVKCWREVPSERLTFEEIVKELNRLRPIVKASTYTGEDLQAPKWKTNSYQKGGLPENLAKEDESRRLTG